MNKIFATVAFFGIILAGLVVGEPVLAASNCTGPTYDAGTRTLSLVCTESTDIHELSCSDVSNPDFLFLSVNGLADTVTCPPDVPTNSAPAIVVTGPTSGGLGATHTFTITGTDAEGDAVIYQVDWDNNSVADYVSGSLPSGTGLDVTQSWATSGSHVFGARGIDANGSSSAWITHTIIISPVVDEASCTPAPASYDCYDQYVTTGFLAGTYLATMCQPVGLPAPAPWTFEMNTAEYTFSGNYPTVALGTILYCGPPAVPPTATIEAQVNSGGWSSGDQTIDPGDSITIRWTSTDSTACVGTNVTTLNATSSGGVAVTEPAPNSSLSYSVNCSGAGGSISDDIIVTANQLANLTEPSVNFTPSATVDPLTGDYDSVTVTFQTGNNGGSDTNTTITYVVDIDYGNDGSYNVSQTGTIGSLVALVGNYNGSVTFTDVPFGNNTIRVRIDSNDDVAEVDEGDNERTLSMSLLPVAPNLQLSSDKEVVREGQTATISWNTGVIYPLNCTVSGPAMATYSFNPSGVGGPTGSQSTGVLSSKSEYLLSCTEPITNTTFTETVSVDVVPTAEEV